MFYGNLIREFNVYINLYRELEMHRLNEYAVPEDIKFLIDNKNLPREELAVTRFG